MTTATATRPTRIADQLLTVGTRVAGSYMGSEFTGTIVRSRRHAINTKAILLTIETDEPVDVFGNFRTDVHPAVNAYGIEESSYTRDSGNDVRLA